MLKLPKAARLIVPLDYSGLAKLLKVVKTHFMPKRNEEIPLFPTTSTTAVRAKASQLPGSADYSCLPPVHSSCSQEM